MLNSLHVLVVDDFEVIRKIHINNLKKMGICHIDEAGDGKSAIDAVSIRNYDLVIIDWYMPGMTGYEALQIMKARGFSKPILMCTDEVDHQNLAMAKQNGASEILRKPYFPTQFRTTVLHLLGIHAD